MKQWCFTIACVLGTLIVCVLQPSWAASSPQNTTMESALREALAWHPTIAAAKAKLTEQQHRQRVAKSGYYPQVSGGVQSGYEGRRDEQKYSQALTLSISQMLYDFGKVRYEVNAEQALVLKHQAELYLAIEDTIRNTASAVFEVWRYQALETMAYEQHQALATLTELVAERNRKGAASRSDLAQSQTRVESAYTQALHYQNQKLLWQNRLASLLGKRQPQQVIAEPAPIPANHCQFTPNSVEAAPSLQIAFALRDSAEAIAKQADARQRPTISLDPNLTHYIETPKWANQADPERTQYGIFLNVNMPLYQGGALSAERKLAQATRMAAEAEIMAERQHILETLFTSASQRQVLERHLSVLEQREALSRETRRLYQQQYLELGARPLIDLLNAEQEIFQTRFEQINVSNDMQLMGLACAYVLGQLKPLFALDNFNIQGINLTP